MYTLIDSFNNAVISRHRSLSAAAKARKQHSAGVKKYNGAGAYIPTELLDADGEKIASGHPEHDAWLDAIDAAMQR